MTDRLISEAAVRGLIDHTEDEENYDDWLDGLDDDDDDDEDDYEGDD